MQISDRIYTIRDRQVMLDRDLAELYGVPTKRLNEQVKRNKERFPESFMFRLTKEEFVDLESQPNFSDDKFLMSQNATSSWGGRRKLPNVFTEQGVAMLSAVLKSKKAVDISIKIIDAFVSMRRFISTNAKIFSRLDRVEMKQIEHDKNFEKVFEAIEDRTLKPKQGIFYDGQVFDAYRFVSDLVRSAERSIILIDNFIDDRTLGLLAKRKNGVLVKVYTRKIPKHDLERYRFQYGPIEIKEFKRSHDRFLIVDDTVYHFGASLKDLGKRWFAFSRLEKFSVSILDRLESL